MLQEYREDIEKKIEDFLNGVSDKELLDKDDFIWFDSILGKFVYLLRYNEFHLGELAQILRNMDGEKLKW
ncbi:MAG: hypothetical protein KGD64_03765 [Candidatus Heimdallarchaeota archaeon]|nr:hypothetical protein [Candidatus Heimdallarchaeota archaeon]